MIWFIIITLSFFLMFGVKVEHHKGAKVFCFFLRNKLLKLLFFFFLESSSLRFLNLLNLSRAYCPLAQNESMYIWKNIFIGFGLQTTCEILIKVLSWMILWLNVFYFDLSKLRSQFPFWELGSLNAGKWSEWFFSILSGSPSLILRAVWGF